LINESVLAELSALVGHDVELLEPSAGCWVVAPVDRARLQVPFWQTVRASPGAGGWRSPGAALAGSAARVEGWSRPRGARCLRACTRSSGASSLPGPAPVAELVAVAARAAGFSAPQLYRAARRIGVARRMAGMTGGRVSSLPEGDAFGSLRASKEIRA